MFKTTKPSNRRPDNAARRRAAYRRNWSAKQSRQDLSAIRDIGEIPPPADPERRAHRLSRLIYFTEYFPLTYTLPFSDDHKHVMDRIDAGQSMALAMPRGSGKTSLIETQCIREICGGLESFLALIGHDKDAACDVLESIKNELETNEELAADFPEVCLPIRALEGIPNRCRGQTHKGRRTRIYWGSDKIVLPTIDGSPASGAVIRCFGIGSRLRGLRHPTADGRKLRPTKAYCDDLQDDDAARNPDRVDKLERKLKGTIKGMAGPGKRLTITFLCTVIVHDDLPDRLLDRERNQQFHGIRQKLLYAFPTNLELWERYNEIRLAQLERDEEPTKATAFYKRHRKKMQAGAKVSWWERCDDGQLDGLEYAMCQFFDDEESFWAEFQNDPQTDQDADDDILDEKQIPTRTRAIERHIAHAGATRVTAFVDVHKELLYYLLLATSDDFTGQVIDYGTYPQQTAKHFTLRSARRTLSRKYPKLSTEARIVQALHDLIDEDLAERTYRTEDGDEIPLDFCFADAGWQASEVFSFVMRSQLKALLLPTFGRGITANQKPINLWSPAGAIRRGHYWRVQRSTKKSAVRYCLFDANYWKTFAHGRLAQPEGPGAIRLFQGDRRQHQMLADHMAKAERWEKRYAGERCVVEWSERTARPENHLFDCIAGAMAAASYRGATLPGHQPPPRPKPRRSRQAQPL